MGPLARPRPVLWSAKLRTVRKVRRHKGLWIASVRGQAGNDPTISHGAEVRQSRSGEAPHAVGDRQPDHDHVHEQAENQVIEFVRASRMERRKG